MRMRISLKAGVRSTPQRSTSRNTALLAGVGLLAMDLVLLYLGFGFAEYGFGGFLWWSQASGTVLSVTDSSAPTVEFVTGEGALHQFHEDYILLCQSRRSLCWVRTFTAGEKVPVVFDPHAPNRAFIDDWALMANSLTWILEALLGLLLLWGLTFRWIGKPGSFSVRTGTAVE